MLCPVCEQEGQQVTVIAGNKSRVIVYHPQKVMRTVCNIVSSEFIVQSSE